MPNQNDIPKEYKDLVCHVVGRNGNVKFQCQLCRSLTKTMPGMKIHLNSNTKCRQQRESREQKMRHHAVSLTLDPTPYAFPSDADGPTLEWDAGAHPPTAGMKTPEQQEGSDDFPEPSSPSSPGGVPVNELSTAKHYKSNPPNPDKRPALADLEEAPHNEELQERTVASPLRAREEYLRANEPELLQKKIEFVNSHFKYNEYESDKVSEEDDLSLSSQESLQSRNTYVAPPHVVEDFDHVVRTDEFGRPIGPAGEGDLTEQPPAPEDIVDEGPGVAEAGSAVLPNATDNPLYTEAKLQGRDNIGYSPLQEEESHFLFSPSDHRNIQLLIHLREMGAPLYAYDLLKHWANPGGRNYTREAFLNKVRKWFPTLAEPEFLRMPLETDELATLEDLTYHNEYETDQTSNTLEGATLHYKVKKKDLNEYKRTKRDTVEVIRYNFIKQMEDLLTENLWANVDNLCINRDSKGKHDDRYSCFRPYNNPHGAQLDDIVSAEFYQKKCKPLVSNPNEDLLLPIIIHVDACGKGKSQRNNVEPVSFSCIIINRA